MKLLGLSLPKVAFAILIGIFASIALGTLLVPHPVETPPIVVTPVPTPAPVYITIAPTPVQQVVYIVQGTPTPTPFPPDSPEYMIVSLLPIIIVGLGIMTIMVSVFAAFRD